MRTFTIRKKSGKLRTVYQPSAEELAMLNPLVKPLNMAAVSANEYGVQHGFQPKRSSVTNALQHKGWRFTLSFDLQDFFDSVTRDKFENTIIDEVSDFDICFPDGAARQGLPTSPALANIAAAPMDKEILEFVSDIVKPKRKLSLAEGIKRDCVYTRYADDLTFSFDSVGWFDRLKAGVPAIVEKHGFKINPEKTRTQAAGAGRRVITGIAVDTKLHPLRSTKRRLRAALHQRHTSEARGLAEWCKLKMPRRFDNSDKKKPTKKQEEKQQAKQQPKAIATIETTKIKPISRRIINLNETETV